MNQCVTSNQRQSLYRLRSHADTLTGTLDPNVLDGGLGNDTLKPLGGADRVIGGDGADWVDYTGSEAIYVDLSQGIGTHGDAQGDTYSGVEHVRGGASNDHLVGTAGANTLAGPRTHRPVVGRQDTTNPSLSRARHVRRPDTCGRPGGT